ncbi:hypothetical protein AYO44_09830 [Planctomycetaceae bacterium SCGC AG-212-F19]|nr:hypothetical protein AYO44_09830 [Planctomycetaceae bacterium SCGC AG-212-F19]
MSPWNFRKRPGLTLMELLVVITIVAAHETRATAADDIAIGYEYTSTHKMKSVMIPKPLKGGQSKFELVVENQTFPLQAGRRFFFRSAGGFPEGVDAFTIRGINESEQLDARNNFAFPTGISWIEEGVTPEVVMKPIIAKRRSLLSSSWVLFGTLAVLALGGAFVAGLVWRRKNANA